MAVDTHPMTTGPDISPEAVDHMVVRLVGGLGHDGSTAAMLRALRSALTASGEALREYGHHKNSCRFVSNVPNPGIRPGSCTCGLEAAMEKANGDPLKDSLERMYASALGQI